MLKKLITYTDYNGQTRTEPFYFHLSNAEIAEMGVGLVGGGSLEEYIERLSMEHDPRKVIGIFKELIQKSYGKKSDDGRRFMKSEEILKEFTESEAYSVLFMELANDAQAASDFFDGIIPELTPEQKAEVAKQRAKMEVLTSSSPDAVESVEG